MNENARSRKQACHKIKFPILGLYHRLHRGLHIPVTIEYIHTLRTLALAYNVKLDQRRLERVSILFRTRWYWCRL